MVEKERVEITVIQIAEITMINAPMVERAEGVVRKTIKSKTTAKTICRTGHKTLTMMLGDNLPRNKLREYHVPRFRAEGPWF